MRARGSAISVVVMVLGCNSSPDAVVASDERGGASEPTMRLADSRSVRDATSAFAPTAPSPSAGAPSEAARDEPPDAACPRDMRLVEGEYCPVVEQVCLAWQEVNVAGVVEKNQCKRYREPTRCLSREREPMRFCMDTYEWPNEKGVIPLDLVSWEQARQTCESVGKRLCTDVEFTFACEGESMRPHVYGFERDATKCSFDRPYRQRTFAFTHHDDCVGDPACNAALLAIDQRLPAGSMPSCVSESGVYDLNGNVNEWVTLPGHGLSKRAGLKGGWWGPVRDRCRPITTFHGESDFGYEVGFRCCSDAARATEERPKSRASLAP